MSDMANYQAPLLAGGPHWLTLSFVLIGLGVLVALVILFWGARLANRRRQVREELQERGELVEVPAYSAPPVTPSPPPLADSPTPATVPEPEPLADEPIVAAAPLDAAPATLAASEPPLGVPAAGDELTRMKGVGPRLADRLNANGITSFAQLAALSPEDADALDAKMEDFRGRIHRDRWIEQARYLAAGDTAGYEAVFGKL